MNHSIPGVNGGYITRGKLLEDHLRRQQQAISSAMFAALGASIVERRNLRQWLGRGMGRCLVFGVPGSSGQSDREQTPRPTLDMVD